MAINLDEAQTQLNHSVAHFEEELKKLRTGRASASILDGIKIVAYGQETPLAHMATIGVVDAQLLQVTPFDPNNLEAISAAIRDDKTLGLNPADDGRVVRLPIPPMTTERRQDVVKILHDKAEQARISFRNTRQELLKSLKQQVADKEISEDDKTGVEKRFQIVMDEMNTKLDELCKAKESEIMTV